MGARIIDCRSVAEGIKKEVSERVSEFVNRFGYAPKLAVLHSGRDEPSNIYLKMKEKAAREAGIMIEKHTVSGRTENVVETISKLNEDTSVHGILVQLPLPEGINRKRMAEVISPQKDVDGFSPENLGRVLAGMDGFAPCTPLGIMRILDKNGIELESRNVVIVNHSSLIGKPLAMMMLNRNATVSVCHAYTKDLAEYTEKADILVSATGIPGLIRGDMVKEGSVVIDAGISKKDGKVRGDVDEGVRDKASHITPVPGGVGPMTVAMLLSNTLEAARSLSGEKE